MRYIYSPDGDFSDFAAGSVFYHRPGRTNFPVRLAREIFAECLSYMNCGKVTFYDPCCGTGYLAAVLGLSFDRISSVYASDADSIATDNARRNLALITPDGMRRRISELEEAFRLYGKQSHSDAIASANRLMAMTHDLPFSTFTADAARFKYDFTADVILFDAPYGELTQWSTGSNMCSVLCNLRNAMSDNGTLAVCADKNQKLECPDLKRIRQQTVGKRRYAIFTK